MEWQELCKKDNALLETQDKEKIMMRQITIGIALLERAMKTGCDMQSGIWLSYQKMLVEL